MAVGGKGARPADWPGARPHVCGVVVDDGVVVALWDGHVSGFGPVLPCMASALVVVSVLPRVR